MRMRCKIDQAFNGIGNVGTPGTPVSGNRHRVGKHHLGLHVKRGYFVDAAHGDTQVLGADEGAEVAVVRADIGLVMKTHGQNATVGIQRHFAVEHQRPAMPITEKNLAARADPTHRPTQLAGCQHQQHVFAIGRSAQAEGATHILWSHLKLRGINAGGGSEKALHAQYALGGRVNPGFARGCIMCNHDGPRLHGHANQALAGHTNPADVASRSKCSVSRNPITVGKPH